jgi:hypothetical protein
MTMNSKDDMQTPGTLKDMIELAQDAMDDTEVGADYCARHGIMSASVLTVTDDREAGLIVQHIAPRIEGKTVVEIGGGIGLLSLHLGIYAKQVYCIEANPMWATGFTACLLATKPKHVSYLFGAADEFAGVIRGDVALFCTHSGVDAMRATAALFADEVIDLYGDLIAANPDAFDPVARTLRRMA